MIGPADVNLGRRSTLLYLEIVVPNKSELARLCKAVGRPWLGSTSNRTVGGLLVRYWVPTLEVAERERAILALAGFSAAIEGAFRKA